MHLLRARFVLILSFVIFMCFAAGADAHVTRVEIFSRTDIQDGHTFGLAGPYEKIVGRVYFAVNPDNLRNRLIVATQWLWSYVTFERGGRLITGMNRNPKRDGRGRRGHDLVRHEP